MFHRSDEQWPIVELVFEESITDLDMARYFVELDNLLRAGQRYFPIVNVANGTKMPTPVQLMRKASWLRRNRKRIAALVPGCGFVCPSPMARAALRSVLAIAPLPRDYFVVDCPDEARAKARNVVRSAGLTVAERTGAEAN